MFYCTSCNCVMYCVFINIIIIIIFMICALYDLGSSFDEHGNEILTTQQLRGMYTEGIVDEIFTNIYDGIIGIAIKGKTTGSFTIMCIKSQDITNNNCDNYDGYQQWWIRKIHRGDEPILKNNIQSEKIKTNVIKKIQSAFPDSNITKYYKNCCDQYRITW
jgi:hypothetical protein